MKESKLTMEAHLLISSQNGKRITVHFTRDETVASFRKKVAETVNIPKEKFLLIAMGKIVRVHVILNRALTNI